MTAIDWTKDYNQTMVRRIAAIDAQCRDLQGNRNIWDVPERFVVFELQGERDRLVAALADLNGLKKNSPLLTNHIDQAIDAMKRDDELANLPSVDEVEF